MIRHTNNLNLLIIVLIAAVLFLGLGLAYIAKQPAGSIHSKLGLPTPGLYPNTRLKDDLVVNVAPDTVTPADKEQLYERILRPVLDYYAEDESNGALTSFTISPNLEDDREQFPYTGLLGFESGESQEFFIETFEDEIQWWQPTCLECSFSSDYQEKYPQVVN